MRIKLFLCLSLVPALTVHAEDEKNYRLNQNLGRASTLEHVKFTPNRISTWMSNNAKPVTHTATGNSGLEWPNGSGKTAIFTSGVYLVGLVDGEARASVSWYGSGWFPGSMIYDPASGQTGVPVDHNDPAYQIYVIEEGDCADPGADCYNREYEEWPDWQGARTTAMGEPWLSGKKTAWYVANDENPHAHNTIIDGEPLGIELQITSWGYEESSPLDNVIFYRHLIVNKGGRDITELYFSNWSDADVGDANDDYAGCDLGLDMGYIYNGTSSDQRYGLYPPAVGHLILKGAHVPSLGDSAFFGGSWHQGFENIGMTSFLIIQNSSNYFRPPETPYDAFNTVRGIGYNGRLYHEYLDVNQPVTFFLYPGDPVTGTGWTQFDDQDPRDHDIFQNSGPFDLPPWRDPNGNGIPEPDEPGVQEIITAIAVVQGANNLDAITSLRHTARYAHTAYALHFQEPELSAPQLIGSELDQELYLDWSESADELENWREGPYRFEGYELFQGHSKSGPWELIATYDLENGIRTLDTTSLDLETGLRSTMINHFGEDNGLVHQLRINSDHLAGGPLVNNRAYHFAIRAYAASPESRPRTVVSPLKILTLRPHGPSLGTEWSYESQDTIGYSQIGPGEPDLQIIVEDRSRFSGQSYRIEFETSEVDTTLSWTIGRVEHGIIVDTLESTTQQHSRRGWRWDPDGHHSYVYYRWFSGLAPFYSGFRVEMEDAWVTPTRFVSSWEQTVNLTESSLDSVTFLAISPGGVDSLVWSDGPGSDTLHVRNLYGPRDEHKWDWPEWLTFRGQTWIRLYKEIHHFVYIQSFASDVGGTDHTIASIPGIFGGDSARHYIHHDLKIRFTESGQAAWRWSAPDSFIPQNSNVPFELWDTHANQQLQVGHVDWNQTGVMHDSEDGTLEGDWIVVIHRPYAEQSADFNTLFNNPWSGLLLIFNTASRYDPGDEVEIRLRGPMDNDVIEFTTPAPLLVNDAAALKQQLEAISVFPNPFLGRNEEASAGEAFVTFSGLHAGDCTLRIFSLAGDLVRKLEHAESPSAGTPFEYWDLRNELGEQVASGMYIVHVEIPEIGSRVLKLAIMQGK